MSPASSGLGGGCFIIFHHEESKVNEFIDAREVAPTGERESTFAYSWMSLRTLKMKATLEWSQQPPWITVFYLYDRIQRSSCNIRLTIRFILQYVRKQSVSCPKWRVSCCSSGRTTWTSSVMESVWKWELELVGVGNACCRSHFG
jgi:hypothetical protein